ncbi:invertebrate-type lysozyme 3-like [Formica exsecta]|uniref:invertebrate-type lysozyme 3-like n=1 Tax=Formica exsecta TaxID=72781 RepID=UPI001141DB97|nr:invertebrate-type lysozyme 3-like [Formica exsecta]XP_029663396.1 invertebrate-type lysozyme 3-like [Formica exsecta]
MFAGFSWIVATIIALFSVCTYAQESASSNQQLVSQVCLDCICETTTGCNMTIGCSNLARPCGPFFIQWSYWVDAGKPTVNNEPSNTNGAFIRCVNDLYCASRAVEAYMVKFNQDCTGDGVIDCDDYLRIHRLGGNGCTGSLDRKYLNKYKLCIQTNGGQ